MYSGGPGLDCAKSVLSTGNERRYLPLMGRDELKKSRSVLPVFCCLLFSFVNAPAQEVVFAVRQPKGPHWYENFGHQITDVTKISYGSRGRLCKVHRTQAKIFGTERNC